MDFEEVMDLVARTFEVAGVTILVVGAIAAVVRAVTKRSKGREFYKSVRTDFGHTLLLGLEVLVAADIVKTVAVDSTLESVAILGILVVVRTLLSISLDAEIDGVWPWRRRRVEMEESQALRR